MNLNFLQDLIIECGRYLAMSQSFPGIPNNQPSQNAIVHQIKVNPYLFNVAGRCQQIYGQCISQKLLYLTPTDYQDFTDMIQSAKKAFYWTQNGQHMYHQLLNDIRRYVTLSSLNSDFAMS